MSFDSRRLANVKSKDTKVEVAVRRMVHSLGVRYRLHDAALPGHPDMVFRGRQRIIFINGCFWHRHQGCTSAQTPKTRSSYWEQKFARTIERDETNYAALKAAGWQVMVVWECELSDKGKLVERLREFLTQASSQAM